VDIYAFVYIYTCSLCFFFAQVRKASPHCSDSERQREEETDRRGERETGGYLCIRLHMYLLPLCVFCAGAQGLPALLRCQRGRERKRQIDVERERRMDMYVFVYLCTCSLCVLFLRRCAKPPRTAQTVRGRERNRQIDTEREKERETDGYVCIRLFIYLLPLCIFFAQIRKAFPHCYLHEPTPIHNALWRVACNCVAAGPIGQGRYAFIPM